MTTFQPPIVVTGATGRQGGAAARSLLKDGRQVRALVRESSSPAARALVDAGAHLVIGDLDDPVSLAAAFAGAAGVFAVPPLSYGPAGGAETEVARGRAVADAAVGAGVSHVVFTSIAPLSGDAPMPVEKARVEVYLRERVPALTVLRPVRFMSNYLAGGQGIDGIDNGVHRHIFPADVPVQMVAVEDVGAFAAMAFADPTRFSGRTVALAGDQLTPTEAVAAISESTGIFLRYRQLTDEQAAALNPAAAKARQLWQDGHVWQADIEVLRILNPGLRTFADWLAETGQDAIRHRHADST